MRFFVRAYWLLSIAILVLSLKSNAQRNSISRREKQLAVDYNMLLKYRRGNIDSLNYYSNKFGNGLKNFIRSTPATLEYPFEMLTSQGDCNITTSEDGNLRIYSWDKETGGTMHFFNEIFQYKADGKVSAWIPEYEESDPGSFCSRIYTIIVNSKSYYLVISNGIYSTKDVSQSVTAFTITKSRRLDSAKLFETRTGLVSVINVSYNFLSVAEQPVKLINYDEAKKALSIAVVDDDGKVMANTILYRLTGDHFKLIGTKRNLRDQNGY